MNRRPIPLTLIALLSVSQFAIAQQPPPMPPTTTSETRRIDLDLSTPTSVADYVDYLRRTFDVNIVVFPNPGVDPAKVLLPSMKLKRIDLATAVGLLNSTNDAKVDISNAPTGGESADALPVIGVNLYDKPPTGRDGFMNVFSLEKLLLGDTPKDRIPDDAEREKALADRAEQLLVLAEQTFAMVPPSGEKPDFRYHAPTHTLLVKATEADAKRVQSLIEALAVPERGPAARQVDWEREREQLVNALLSARQQLEASDARNTVLRKELDKRRATSQPAER